MNYNQNSIQIFTFDKETERRTGALTKMIFAVCFSAFPILIGIFGMLGASLLPSLLSDLDSFMFYDPYLIILVSIVSYLMIGVLTLSFIIMLFWSVPAIYQLLRCYCLLEDGRFVMLEWRPVQRHGSGSFIAISTMKTYFPNMNSTTTRRGIRAAFGLRYGIRRIQNRQWVQSFLSGEVQESLITGYIINNIKIVKESRSQLVIQADVHDGERVKRRKLRIYRMYHQMETIRSICERGGRS